MWNASKGVSKIKKSYVQSFLVNSSILNHFFKYNIMLNASVYSWKKGLLHFWINETIDEEIVGSPLSKNKMVGFADSTSQCNHSEVGGIFI